MKMIKNYFLINSDNAIYIEKKDNRNSLSYYKDKDYIEIEGNPAKYAIEFMLKYLTVNNFIEEDGFNYKRLKKLI